ncbi:hypothetical protein EN858_19825 [Mesorhizobium sp. M4B.F.Ca.ET.215.01.1.1]|uniref:hypothetical protein n=2 Tax=Mesorhizobium TaxID=68287 RepID=UPI000FCC66A3|nr:MULTISPECIES: hypothetical protein [unclassified Mesorhizobium]RUW22592.1 hypothetical protein EOA34_20995 [Mesorhizobium sp. M4B.F.Ca.ET.013.02.1.1]RUW77992.1 hypothetical protein EOA31_03075 [Mesorhizobium sp. M4B.F.Ca.ET.049.02.1.2]RWF67123.1 MAG: hypothetical protein EOS47_03190 [Mesorhizobium sp.]TGQ09530.1 hypothetical protein EN858_19825 [Mesorhizobium sp. M4B.F.Ca.ET.215.01.1.1]TGQ36964.1 hypothetical protein EN857_15290 [Mesorhizobium sp. M4B.F.Ca.ET.214.01.1.1]
MTSVAVLREEQLSALRLTAAGRPRRTANPFSGVGPITDLTLDEVGARPLRFEFEAWLYLGFAKTNQMAFGLGGGHRIFQQGAF